MKRVAESVQPRLSLIVPAYNESLRLGAFLDQALPYLDESFPAAWELIVVDDGSRDETGEVVRRRARAGMVLIRHQRNLGKGAAVRTGAAFARGAFVLFADADGATPIEEEQRLRRVIEAGADVAIGSREAERVLADAGISGPSGEAVRRDVRWHRHIIGRTFALLVNTLLGLRYLDTQCGFKMFRHDVARTLFSRITQAGYIFDVELLCLARRYGYRVAEVPVSWHDVPGAKVNLVSDSWRMLVGMFRIRLSTRTDDRVVVLANRRAACAAEPTVEYFQ